MCIESKCQEVLSINRLVLRTLVHTKYPGAGPCQGEMKNKRPMKEAREETEALAEGSLIHSVRIYHESGTFQVTGP